MARLANLPARLDDETLGNVERYAQSTPPALPPTDEQHLLEFMRLMSDMPRQTADLATGAIKIENMVRHLGHLPRACINWMNEQVHPRFRFYPTIQELLGLASEWRRADEPVRARQQAEVVVRRELNARVDEARAALRAGERDQDAIDRLSPPIARVMVGEGLLARCAECGSFSPRRPRLLPGQWA